MNIYKCLREYMKPCFVLFMIHSVSFPRTVSTFILFATVRKPVKSIIQYKKKISSRQMAPL